MLLQNIFIKSTLNHSNFPSIIIMKIQKNAECIFQEVFLNAFKQQMNNETVLKETLIVYPCSSQNNRNYQVVQVNSVTCKPVRLPYTRNTPPYSGQLQQVIKWSQPGHAECGGVCAGGWFSSTHSSLCTHMCSVHCQWLISTPQHNSSLLLSRSHTYLLQILFHLKFSESHQDFLLQSINHIE